MIGMPGCARSPKLNGFDWVLQLLLAGIPLGRETLADLAAGGLLGEIASRPMSRIQAEQQAHKKAETPQKMACVLLAAGQSRRMGGTNKLLMEIRGKPVIRHAAKPFSGWAGRYLCGDRTSARTAAKLPERAR